MNAVVHPEAANVASVEELRRGPQEQSTAIVRAGFFDLAGFELLQRVAKAFALSTLVPQQYQGNIPNCMIALNLARRLQADELMVMQNLYIVHGNPGWSSKFLIASVNTCGRFNNLRYEWRGDPAKSEFGCRAWTIEKATGERLDGAWVDWRMVKAEKWDAKSGSKWLTMPEQMFMYRSAAFWQRAYAPEISMGLPTAEELADVIDLKADGTYTVSTESLRANMNRVDETLGEINGSAESRGGAQKGEQAQDKGDEQPKDQPVVTFAEVADKIAKAKSADDLVIARDLARGVQDTAQRKELEAKADAREKEFAKPAATPAPTKRRSASQTNAE